MENLENNKGKKRSTREHIITGFRELLLNGSFERITVTGICKHVGVSRKTFYTYFRDKNDIVEQIIFDNISKPILDLHIILKDYDSATTIILERIYQALYDDRAFFEKISFYTGQNSFQEIIIEQTSAINLQLLAEYNMPAIEKEYMAHYYAASHAMILVKWINDKMPISPKVMAGFYEKWALKYWNNLKLSLNHYNLP